ncbi:hypothetical protein KI387_037390, partial [Taxus chinensis]
TGFPPNHSSGHCNQNSWRLQQILKRRGQLSATRLRTNMLNFMGRFKYCLDLSFDRFLYAFVRFIALAIVIL